MITGQLTLFPKCGKETYTDSKNKVSYRHLPCTTSDGINIYITVSENIFEQYKKDFALNEWNNVRKFRIWGEIKSINEKTEGCGLSNLYIRVELLVPDNSNKEVNLFSINAYGTKTSDTESNDLYNYFNIAANKNILNGKEKIAKPSYACLRTNKRVSFHEKDIIQGTAKLIETNGKLQFESLYVAGFSSGRKLIETFLIDDKLKKVS